jgi:myo-inositol-1(or 4)-monophosphatase
LPAPDLALLTEAARAAGRIALRHWKRAPRSWDKGGDQGPVSEADLAVNDMLATTLRAARPEYGWLSEETPDDTARLAARRVFIIDPIDGTRAFLAGEDSFAHSLAVAEEGRIVAAVVYLPAMDRLYSASLTDPARRDGAPIATSARAEVAGADILTTKAALAPENWPRGVPALHRSFRASLAFRLCLAAEGRHDGMVTFRDAWEWDIAAGALIAAQAGCAVTDRRGGAIAFNAAHPRAPGVICANPALHRALLAHAT